MIIDNCICHFFDRSRGGAEGETELELTLLLRDPEQSMWPGASEARLGTPGLTMAMAEAGNDQDGSVPAGDDVKIFSNRF